jgi:hypothetical protein
VEAITDNIIENSKTPFFLGLQLLSVPLVTQHDLALTQHDLALIQHNLALTGQDFGGRTFH